MPGLGPPGPPAIPGAAAIRPAGPPMAFPAAWPPGIPPAGTPAVVLGLPQYFPDRGPPLPAAGNPFVGLGGGMAGLAPGHHPFMAAAYTPGSRVTKQLKCFIVYPIRCKTKL